MLGTILAVIGTVCWIIILVDAFKKSVVKGLIALFCWIYLIYYGVAEFENDNKWLIVLPAIFGILGWFGFSRLF